MRQPPPPRIAPPSPGENAYWLAELSAATHAGLPEDARRYASLFDGRRDAQARLQAARERFGDAVDAAALHEAALDLAIAGLLIPGRLEPLPPPTQVETDPWGQPAHYGFERGAAVPSLLPGSLAAPGLPGAIGGVYGASRRGGDNPIRLALAPRPWSALGRPFALAARHPVFGWLVALLVVVGLVGFWNHRYEVARDLLHLAVWWRLLLSIFVTSTLIGAAGQCARLWMIRRETGRWPRFGMVLIMGVLPRLLTDTAGPAENTDIDARSRILLAVPLASLTLAAVGLYGWFLTRGGPTLLPALSIVLTTTSLISFLALINPLARRDGYYWLAHRLGAPDLRDQAWMTVLGVDRPWKPRTPPSRHVRLLYAVLSAAYIVTVLTLYVLFPARWLEEAYGGPGVVFFVTALSLGAYQQSRRGFSFRTSLEPFRVKFPKLSKTQKIIAAVAAVLFLLPYPYEPSGKAVVLPYERAEVHALVPGEVREVLVKEGELVEAGQELLRLSDGAAKAQLAVAEATLQRARSELAIVKTGGGSEEVKLARENLATARKRMEVAQAEADRMANAYRRRAVSPQDYETARGMAEVRQQEAAEAAQRLRLVGNPAREERIAALEAEVAKAQAEVEYRQEQLDHTVVRAPIAGRVASGQLLFARGKYYALGDPIAVIDDTGRLQAELQMPESTIGKIKHDADATLRVWAFPGTDFDGHVVHIAPDAQISEYGKVVRVRVLLDEVDPRLKPEMTGQGKVHSHWTIAGFAFTRALVRFLLVEVWSWLP